MLPITSALLFDEVTRKRRKRHLLVMIGCALFMMMLTFLSLFDQGVGDGKTTLVEVFVSKNELKTQHQLTPDDIVTKKFPPDLLPDAHLMGKKELIGKTLLKNISKSEIFLPNHFYDGKINPMTFSSKIPGNFSAFSFPQSWVEAPFPPLTIGDSIDVLASFSREDIESTGFVVEKVSIIEIQEDKSAGGKVIILSVSAEQASQILFARGARIPMTILLRSQL